MSIVHWASNISNLAGSAITLAFNPVLVSEFHTEGVSANVWIQFILRTDGTYDVVTSNGTGDKTGDWKSPNSVDTTTYEYRITHAENGINQGSVFAVLGGIIDGTWTTLASDDGIQVQVPDPGPASINRQDSDITFEVREILTPANTTGEMAFASQAENDRS